MLVRSPSAGAERARRSRARRRVGRSVVHIEVDTRRIAAALSSAGRLADATDASREEIEHELARVLADFCDRWLGPPAGKKSCA